MITNKSWYEIAVLVFSIADLVIFSMFSSDIPLGFHESIQVVPPKYLMYFLAGINAKQFWNIPEYSYFAPLRTLNLFIKSFVNIFLDISLISFDSSFNSFLFKFLVSYQNLSFL